ncbi:Uncaracterized surface protein containing fasciclin (FAS1) repeats [Mycolicibacterium rutilum]|uniref:Uncaracterized surface protein containing fasciclin (FAS1) repeats n=1 Tax=Mycolicibacterium rutilum TaxID=370526 RepID=A0A1H6LH28_MYCRU|nr:fasciclin domain-containing protein [Mycolicibacterium rutilum]SEH85376.1 Uncaracterized surface protein containing fasciclin (FAS1) repeats [Mycolicibacterium rutilum]
MNIEFRKAVSAAGLAAAAVLTISACSNDATSPTASAQTGSSATSAAPAPMEQPVQPAGPVGPGCADYAAQNPSGPGSVAGMAMDPVTVAASNNPMLTTLTSALSGKLNPNVNLVETLDSGEFTVFAPTDAAFAKIDPATIEQLKTDSALLTNILTYHVVPGQADPAQVVGTHKTVQGADVNVTGGGEAIKVDDANVVCGGVRTANATVYLIDTVLMP